MSLSNLEKRVEYLEQRMRAKSPPAGPTLEESKARAKETVERYEAAYKADPVKAKADLELVGGVCSITGRNFTNGQLLRMAQALLEDL